MKIFIKEENAFMPTTTIDICEDKIEFCENNRNRQLNYNKEQIKQIIEVLLGIIEKWNSKYIEKKIIDDEIYTITIEGKETKQIYIKNKYPSNWEKFVLFRNKLVRGDLKI